MIMVDAVVITMLLGKINKKIRSHMWQAIQTVPCWQNMLERRFWGLPGPFLGVAGPIFSWEWRVAHPLPRVCWIYPMDELDPTTPPPKDGTQDDDEKNLMPRGKIRILIFFWGGIKSNGWNAETQLKELGSEKMFDNCQPYPWGDDLL